MASTGFVAFIILLFIGIYLSLFGLPGTIVIFLDVLLYGFFTGFGQVGWKVLLFLLCFAILAETLDFVTGLNKAHKTPLIKGSLWAAAIGAAIGMIILTPLLWGLGTWAGFFLGGLTGILVVELHHQYRLKAPQQVSNGAFFAMMGRKALKGSLALVMILVSLSAIYS